MDSSIMPPQNNNSKDYDRHDIKKDIDNMDINNNEDVLRIQKRLNTFLSIYSFYNIKIKHLLNHKF